MFGKKSGTRDIVNATERTIKEYQQILIKNAPPEDDLESRARFLMNARSQAQGIEFYAKRLEAEFDDAGFSIAATALITNIEDMLEFNFSKMTEEQFADFEKSLA